MTETSKTEALWISGLDCFYGGVQVLYGLDLVLNKGEVLCLLGRNGAGKTTTILTVMGYLKPRPGRILFNGRDIAALPPYAVARLGFGFVPQERGIFPSLTVRENLTVFARKGSNGAIIGSLATHFDLCGEGRAQHRREHGTRRAVPQTPCQ